MRFKSIFLCLVHPQILRKTHSFNWITILWIIHTFKAQLSFFNIISNTVYIWRAAPKQFIGKILIHLNVYA